MEHCPYAKKCGGCNQHYILGEYEKSLQIKQKQVEQLLRPFGKVQKILGAKNPYHYRNKVHMVVGSDRSGNIITGTYEAGTHRLVPIADCLLDDECADAIIRTIARLMTSFHYKAYQEDTGRGFLRHILIRTAHATGQIMVTLVIAEKIFPSKNNFVRALREAHPEITTIVSNFNDRRTSMVLGNREEVLYGKGYIEDELCGKRFRISSRSFYQINPEQTEILYRTAIDYAGLTGKERILDAYSGIGTIGICASDHAASVTGVELNQDAVQDAVLNCKLNGLQKARYLQGDAGDFMVRDAAAGHRYDVVFMDPPRSGSDENFLRAIVKASPKRIVYISCNPQTLAQDLKYLTKHGYCMRKCQPVDMFCFTEHVETVVMLSHKKTTA